MSFLTGMVNGGSRDAFGNNMLGSSPTDLFKKGFKAEAAFMVASDVTSQIFNLNVTPFCMLGPIPLYTVSFFEAAKSDKTLKFRSIGGQFFAFQEADSLGVRIDCKLTGPLRFIWLHALNMLYMRGLGRWGTQEAQEVETDLWSYGPLEGMQLSSGGDVFTGRASPFNFSFTQTEVISGAGGDIITGDVPRSGSIGRGAQGTDSTIHDTMGGEIESSTPFREMPYWANKRRILRHKTFNLITKEEIFVRMFIETLIWSRSLNRDGEDEISVNILLRRYVEPPDILMFDLREPQITTEQRTAYEVSGFVEQNGQFISQDRAQIDAAIATIDSARPPTGGTRRQGAQRANYTRAINLLENLANNQAPLDPHDPGDFSVITQGARLTRYDHYSLDLSRQRRYFGTVPDPGVSADFKLLNVNFAWRVGWSVREVTYSMYSSRRLANDPLVGRVMQIIGSVRNEVESNNGNVDFTSYLPYVGGWL